MASSNEHVACVDAWLSRLAVGSHVLDVPSLLDGFERVAEALWREAADTLGEVTVDAIAGRAAFLTHERFPRLPRIALDNGGASLRDLREQAGALDAVELRGALRFLLIELLQTLGDLTADVLTPWLHAAVVESTTPPTAAPDRDEGPNA